MILVRVDCEYPGTELPPTSVVFEPLGLGTSASEVDAAFRSLLAQLNYFEIETTTEGVLPFCSETARRVLVWSRPDRP